MFPDNEQQLTDLLALHFYTKLFHVIYQARAFRGELHQEAKADRDRPPRAEIDRWFNLEIPDSDPFPLELSEIYQSLSSILATSRPSLLRIHVLLVVPESSSSQVLVTHSQSNTPWRKYTSMILIEPTPRYVLLETWTMKLTPNAHSPTDVSLPTSYRHGIPFFRSLYTLLRILPTWKLFKKLGRTGPAEQLSIQLRASEGGDDNWLKFTGHDDRTGNGSVLHFDKPPTTGHPPLPTLTHTFPSIPHTLGSFTLSTTYLESPTFQLDREPLLSSEFISLDEGGFVPTLSSATTTVTSHTPAVIPTTTATVAGYDPRTKQQRILMHPHESITNQFVIPSPSSSSSTKSEQGQGHFSHLRQFSSHYQHPPSHNHSSGNSPPSTTIPLPAALPRPPTLLPLPIPPAPSPATTQAIPTKRLNMINLFKANTLLSSSGSGTSTGLGAGGGGTGTEIGLGTVIPGHRSRFSSGFTHVYTNSVSVGSGGSGESDGSKGKGPEPIPISVPESRSGVIDASGGSPAGRTGSSGEGSSSSPLARTTDEKSNSRSSLFLGERTEDDDDDTWFMPRKPLDGRWKVEADASAGGEGTQQATDKREWTDGADGTSRTVRGESGSSVVSEVKTRHDITVGRSDIGDEDGDEGGEGERHLTTQPQTTTRRRAPNMDTDTTSSNSSGMPNTSCCGPSSASPTDLSDPNLYKAYLCRVLNIEFADVVDFTGHIDRDQNQFIAAGGSGEVYKALWKDIDENRLIDTPQVLPMVVVKLITLPPIRDEVGKGKRYKRMTRELELWSKLSHPHILHLIGIARIQGDANLPAFISPWMENGNVMEFLRQDPSLPASKVLKEIMKGLHYLHNFNPVIVHGDLKGANVLINHRKEACLSDFGLSRFVVDNTLWCTTATHANGTLRWMAPELMEGDVNVPTIATDIYAFGMTCYEILSRESPFAAANDAVVISKVIKGQRPKKIESCHSDEIWSIIARCWAQEPENRPSTEETLTLVLQHDTP